jgi:tetratricopeptide (TPR) repeat protein
MKRKQSLSCHLMVAFICSICCFSSSAVAQQKLDQAALEQWRADLRYMAEELPRRHKNLFAALFVLGDAYERTGDLKQAIESYEKSLALNPKNWELVDQLKALREKQGRSGQ